MTATMKAIYLRALHIKFNQEPSIPYEDTLASWTKLTEAEKQELRDALAAETAE
jgi:hypothetical protein